MVSPDDINAKPPTRTSVGIRAVLIASLGMKLMLWALVVATDPTRFLEPDSRDYLGLAHMLTEHHVFATSLDDMHVPETNRTPGYPLLLAMTFAFFGDAYAWPALVQIGLSLGTLGFVAHLGRRTFRDSRIVLTSVVICALDPLSLAFTALLRTETLFTFLLLAATVAGVRACRAGTHRRWAVVSGVLLAAAALVRPIAYFLPLPFAAIVGAVGAAGRGFSVRLAAATLVPAVLIMGGWQARNFVVAETWAFSDMIGRVISWRAYGSERVGGSTSDMSSRAEDPQVSLLQRSIGLVRIHARNAVGMMMGPGEQRLIRLLGYSRRDAPGLDLARLVDRRGAGSTGSGGAAPTLSWFVDKWFSPPRWPTLVFLFACIHLALVHAGALLWVGRVWRERHWVGPQLLLAGIVIYFLVVSFASSRFRAPIMPFLALFAAAGLVGVVDRFSLPARQR